MGLEDVELDQNGYLMATLPANVEGKPTIGLIAHMDTAPDASGKMYKGRFAESVALSTGIPYESIKF